MYFSATIFALVGFGSPILTSLSIALTNFLFTVVAFHAIDRIGRRRILLLSIPVMVAGLALCSVAFNFIKLPMDGQKQEQVGQGSKAWPLVILGAMVIYVAGYAVGLGCVPWQQSEYVSSFPSQLSPPLSPFSVTIPIHTSHHIHNTSSHPYRPIHH